MRLDQQLMAMSCDVCDKGAPGEVFIDVDGDQLPVYWRAPAGWFAHCPDTRTMLIFCSIECVRADWERAGAEQAQTEREARN